MDSITQVRPGGLANDSVLAAFMFPNLFDGTGGIWITDIVNHNNVWRFHVLSGIKAINPTIDPRMTVRLSGT